MLVLRFFCLGLFAAQACHGQAALVTRTIETDTGTIRYSIVGPFAVTEGDIILGTAQEIEAYREARERGISALKPRSLTTSVTTQLWPNATLYYTIDADVPNQQSILDAIAHWNTRTSFRILPRTTEPNYVRFQRIVIDAACNSNIGMIGGAQSIGITNNCPTGSVIHELGHSWGLWHEQQRTDRSGHMTVLYENIDKRFISNFPQASTAADTGYYDFDSIMHYPASGFSRNYQDALETVPPGIPIGQRDGLSAGDIYGVSHLYNIPIPSTTITTTPAGLTVLVDGAATTGPTAFTWAAGTQHTIAAEAAQGTEPRYQFQGWSDDGAASHTITALATGTAVSAQFVRQHPFATGISSGQGVVSSFPLAAGGYMNERARVRLSATPAAGYQFVRWTGITYLGSSGQSVSANPAQVEVFDGASSYQAIFTNGPVTTIDSKPQGAAVLVDGGSYLTPVNFAWVPGSTHSVNYASPQLFGNSTMRMQFMNWEDGSTGPRTLTGDAAPKTYLATFSQQYLLTLSQSGTGTVTASPSSADGYYDAGSTVQANAAPATGQTFRYWLGDAAGGAPSAGIKMDEDRLATAYFGSTVPLRMLNSASFLSTTSVGSSATTVAPGEIVALFGAGLGPAKGIFGAVGADGKLPFTLGGTVVTFDGVAAPLLYVSEGQINAIVPYGVAGKVSSVLRVTAGTVNLSSTIGIGETSPALFTYDGSGVGQLAALNENGTINSPANPAAPGSVVVLYGTGAGAFDKSFSDGQILGADLGRPRAPVWVRFGKLPGDILYAGTAPFLVNGALQVNVRLPADLIGGGAVPVQLLVGTTGSQTGISISVSAAR